MNELAEAGVKIKVESEMIDDRPGFKVTLSQNDEHLEGCLLISVEGRGGNVQDAMNEALVKMVTNRVVQTTEQIAARSRWIVAYALREYLEEQADPKSVKAELTRDVVINELIKRCALNDEMIDVVWGDGPED